METRTARPLPTAWSSANALPDGTMQVQAFGYQDVEHTVPMTEEAVFDLGSIQKNFRWTMLHHLAEEGELDIEADVDSIVTEMELPATFRELSMHNAGLKHWTDTPELTVDVFADPSAVYSFEQTISYLGDDPFVANPGRKFHYSNYGPRIAVEAIERTTGQGIDELTDERVLVPFGMENTWPQDGTHPDNLVDGWWTDDSDHTWGDDPAHDKAFASAAGGLLFSDACDLLRYAQGVFHDPSYISNETLLQMLQSPIKGSGGRVFAGFTSFAPEVMAGHFGSGQHGHSSGYMTRFTDGASLVVLTNAAPDGVPDDPHTDAENDARPGDDYNTVISVMVATFDWNF
jgi:CubicO group peptidase (beta-lactamase class C family)